MGEHRLRVDICTSDGSAPNYDTKLTIFVGNLPFDIRENQLIEHFSACVGDNDIDFVRIIRDRMTGVGKGIAFVAFKVSTFNCLS
jgi:nucleolar protein 12